MQGCGPCRQAGSAAAVWTALWLYPCMRPDTPAEALGASWASFCAQVARAAQRAGADLKEGFEVGKDVSFDKEAGLWTVKSTDVSAEWGGAEQGFASALSMSSCWAQAGNARCHQPLRLCQPVKQSCPRPTFNHFLLLFLPVAAGQGCERPHAGVRRWLHLSPRHAAGLLHRAAPGGWAGACWSCDCRLVGVGGGGDAAHYCTRT